MKRDDLFTHVGLFLEDGSYKQRATNDPEFRKEYLARQGKYLQGEHVALPHPMTHPEALEWFARSQETKEVRNLRETFLALKEAQTKLGSVEFNLDLLRKSGKYDDPAGTLDWLVSSIRELEVVASREMASIASQIIK